MEYNHQFEKKVSHTCHVAVVLLSFTATQIKSSTLCLQNVPEKIFSRETDEMGTSG